MRRRAVKVFSAAAVLLISFHSPAQQSAPASSHNEVLIKNAVVMTVAHGNIQNGSIYVKDGKIAAVGTDVSAPSSATVIDAGGKYVTPGIVDSHSHTDRTSSTGQGPRWMPEKVGIAMIVIDPSSIARPRASGMDRAIHFSDWALQCERAQYLSVRLARSPSRCAADLRERLAAWSGGCGLSPGTLPVAHSTVLARLDREGPAGTGRPSPAERASAAVWITTHAASAAGLVPRRPMPTAAAAGRRGPPGSRC